MLLLSVPIRVIRGRFFPPMTVNFERNSGWAKITPATPRLRPTLCVPCPMKRSLKNLRFHQVVENDRIEVIRQRGGRLVYDWNEFDELIYYILDTFVEPSKRRQGIAKKCWKFSSDVQNETQP